MPLENKYLKQAYGIGNKIFANYFKSRTSVHPSVEFNQAGPI